jgi:hypothetical protein
MVVSFVIALELLAWLSWIDSLEDANLSEVLERQLHPADGITARQILGGFSLDVLFNSSHFL